MTRSGRSGSRGMPVTPRSLIRAVVFTTILASASIAVAQGAVLRTVTLNAIGESVGVYIERVDLPAAATIPPAIRMPGDSVIGAAIMLPTGDRVLFDTATRDASRRDGAQSFTVGCWMDRFREDSRMHIEDDAGVVMTSAAILTTANPNRPPYLLRYGWRNDGGVRRAGIMATYEINEDGLKRAMSAPLPGVPVDAALQSNLARAAFVCLDAAGTNAILHIRDLIGRNVILESETITSVDGRFGEARGIDADAAGERIVVATSGYDLEDRASVWTTWIHIHDGVSGARLAPPVRAPGQLPVGGSFYMRAGEVWIATMDESRGESYISSVDMAADRPALKVRHTMAGAMNRPVVVHDPRGHDAAAAAGDRIEILPDGHPRGNVIELGEPVRTITWNEEGLFAGAGNRAHLIDIANQRIQNTVAVKSGVVDAIIPLPGATQVANDLDQDGLNNRGEYDRGTSPTDPDSDRDGIHDGIDPQPVTPSPILDTPRTITLHTEAIGHELRGVLIDADHMDGYRWRIDYDRTALPWLAITPLRGTGPGVFYAGIDPSRWEGEYDTPVTSPITIALTNEKGHAYRSPAVIDVVVLPRRNKVRRVLWMHPAATMADFRDEDSGNTFAELANAVAGAPLYLSQRTTGSGAIDDLLDYTVVIAPIDALIDSEISRTRLLEYVRQGGSLLFIADYAIAQEAVGILDTWLAPAGITLDLTAQINGAFDVVTDHELAESWPAPYLASGIGFRAQPPAQPLALNQSDAPQVAVAVAQYGRGRICAIADKSLADPKQSKNADTTPFIIAAIDWLANARVHVLDKDDDGLPDAVEDRDGDSIVDPGESDFLNADTDGDGIPDNEEDRNASGRTEDGETSPLNPDSDGDGIWDGADLAPLPARGAPRIIAVEPNAGPGQGGGMIAIQGENFASNSIVFFGQSNAARVQVHGLRGIIAEVPPSPQPGAVPLRVVNPSTGMEGALPGAYIYEPISRPVLSLHAIGGDRVSLRLTLPAEATISRFACRIDLDSGEGGAPWAEVAPGGLCQFTGRAVLDAPAPNNGLWITLSEGRPITTSGEIAVVYVDTETAASVVSKARVGWARIQAPNGVPLNPILE